jgi:hypothetical protein
MEQLKQMSKQTQLSDASGSRGEAKNMKSLMRFNDLVYEELANASLISQRHLERFNSQSLNYSSESSSCDFIFQTGDQLLDAENSCIQFDLKVTTNTNTETFDFKTGSVMNIFRDAILHSRMGDEVDRIDSVNVYRANADLHEERDFFESAATLMGYESVNLAVNTSHFFQIPLSKILNIFATGRLMPAQLVSGARLQLNIEKASKRLFKFSSVATGVSWTLSNVRLVCCLSRPTDAVARELEKQSASNSLEFVWPAVYTQKRAVTTEINEQVSKSVARALTLRVVPLANPADNSDLIMTPQEVKYTQAQVRAGSVYYPQYRLEDPEIYHASLSALGKVGKSVRFSKSEAELEGDIWVTSLETHGLIHYSGTSLNNSRVLYIETQFSQAVDTGIGAGAEAFVFLDYMRSCRIYLNSLAIDS